MLSYPNSNPPRAETLAAIKRGRCESGVSAWAVRLLVSTSRGLQRSAAFLRRFENRSCRQHEAEGVRHPGVPRRRAGHLRRVIGNDDAVEVIAVKNVENANHVHIAFVDESFAIVRHLPHDVAKMNVSDLALFAVLVDRVVDVAFG